MKQALLLVLATTALAASSATAAAPVLLHPTGAEVRPQPFTNCTALVSYAKSHFAVTKGIPDPPVVPIAVTGVATPTTGGKTGGVSTSIAGSPASPTSSGAGTTYSTTNNQEQGVDEPDIVKTDGTTIFTFEQNKLYAISANGGKPAVVGSLDLGTNVSDGQMFLHGNRLLVMTQLAPQLIAAARPIAGGIVATSPYYYNQRVQTTLTEVDVSDPAHMAVTQTETVDGRFVDGRQNGDTARLVIASAPSVIAEPQLQTATSGYVPMRTFHDLRTGRRFVRDVAPCRSIRRPVDFSGLGMTTIITVDFDKGLGMAHSDALMADAQVVYGSQGSLYFATQRWVNPQLGVAFLPSDQTTVIDRFDVSDPDATTFVASGEVPGYLLNQFSLSEYNGYLRVATTSRPNWWAGQPEGSASQSFVTVLGTNGNVMEPVGQVSGLGQGEQIYSVRFIDDTGYVVTYRQVDPLYTIDLSTPNAPRVAGQLDLSGYSAYLHPLSDGLLLGVGSAVDDTTNEPTGTQLDLFDVSDASNPKLLQQYAVGTGSSSTVSYDHHAFLYWPATSLAVLPVQIYPSATPVGTSQPFIGAIGYQVDKYGIKELGRVTHDAVNGATPPIDRSLVIGSDLYTVSSGGVMASTLDTLTREAFAAFPTPLSGPGPGPTPGVES